MGRITNEYLNIMGLTTSALGNEIVVDTNRKNLKEAFDFISNKKSEKIIWVITPYKCTIVE